jgi:microcystin-dependent protein
MSAVAPSTVPIQIESIQTGNPVSESSLSAMGGAINYTLLNKSSVGDIVMSALDQATFQSQRDTTWVLCDGRSVIGSTYQSLTSQTNIPDLRGRYPRGKDNGSGNDTHGDLAIGTYEADQPGPHQHMVSFPALAQNITNGSGGAFDAVLEEHNVAITGQSGLLGHVDSTGSGVGAETNPRSVVVNFFIKVN